jgi:hypothetical protein
MMRGMVIDMNDEQLDTLAQLQAFLDGTKVVGFAVAAEARYEFIARTVRRFGYARLRRAEKAVVLRFLERVSGYSRQQLTRPAHQALPRLTHQLCSHLHECGCAFARPHRYPARHAIGLGHQEAHGARP